MQIQAGFPGRLLLPKDTFRTQASFPGVKTICKPTLQHIRRRGLHIVSVARPTNGGVLAPAAPEPPAQESSTQGASSILAPAFHSLGVDPACLVRVAQLLVLRRRKCKHMFQGVHERAHTRAHSYTCSH